MSVKAIPMEDWLRGCVFHDGRHGSVILPCDKVLEIANYIQTSRTSGTDGCIDVHAPTENTNTPTNTPTDLISRQDAIEAIARDIPFITFTEDPKRTAQRIIGTVPSADRPTGWIPVSERLPENSGCVLISIAGDIEFGAYDRQNSDWAIWRDGYWDEGKRADAWMPLPEPYREDGEA